MKQETPRPQSGQVSDNAGWSDSPQLHLWTKCNQPRFGHGMTSIAMSWAQPQAAPAAAPHFCRKPCRSQQRSQCTKTCQQSQS
eukprot:3026394-Amphidinium_carterae.1